MLKSSSLFQMLFYKRNVVGGGQNSRLLASFLEPDVPHPASNAEDRVLLS